MSTKPSPPISTEYSDLESHYVEQGSHHQVGKGSLVGPTAIYRIKMIDGDQITVGQDAMTMDLSE